MNFKLIWKTHSSMESAYVNYHIIWFHEVKLISNVSIDGLEYIGVQVTLSFLSNLIVMEFGSNCLLYGKMMSLFLNFQSSFSYSLFAARQNKQPSLHFLAISLMLVFMLQYWLVFWSKDLIWASFFQFLTGSWNASRWSQFCLGKLLAII